MAAILHLIETSVNLCHEQRKTHGSWLDINLLQVRQKRGNRKKKKEKGIQKCHNWQFWMQVRLLRLYQEKRKYYPRLQGKCTYLRPPPVIPARVLPLSLERAGQSLKGLRTWTLLSCPQLHAQATVRRRPFKMLFSKRNACISIKYLDTHSDEFSRECCY